MANGIRLLRADEIDVRVGTAKSGGKGASFLLYKDARCDMNILDETFGAENWQRDHKELKGNVYCGVSIFFEDRGWVTKWDAGAESNTEAVKGEASDSFKRACVNVGIGRELYTAPFIWVPGNPDELKQAKLFVQEISYNEKREISKLVIADKKTNKAVYTFGVKPPQQSKKYIVTSYLRANDKAREWAFGVYPQFDTLEDFTETVCEVIYKTLKDNGKIK